jgi:hypothetical protein
MIILYINILILLVVINKIISGKKIKPCLSINFIISTTN